MTRRLEFGVADVHYLANLCHNCGACLHACQYAPPHEFAVNVPRAMAQVRVKTYEEFAWPSVAAAYRRNGATVGAGTRRWSALFLVLGMAMTAACVRAARGQLLRRLPAQPDGGDFRRGVPVRSAGARHRRRALRRARLAGGPQLAQVTAEAIATPLTLKYLDGGHGDGCNDENDRFTLRRRRVRPLHLLRLHALLRGERRGHDLPLRVRLARALRVHQPARGARHGGRHRPADRTGRLAVAEPKRTSCTATRTSVRWTSPSSACFLRVADWPAAAVLVRHPRCPSAAPAPGVVLALSRCFPMASSRTPCTVRGASEVRHRAAPAEPAGTGRGSTHRPEGQEQCLDVITFVDDPGTDREKKSRPAGGSMSTMSPAIQIASSPVAVVPGETMTFRMAADPPGSSRAERMPSPTSRTIPSL